MDDKKLKHKRMVYIYEENLDFYNALENKSQFINDAIQDERITGRIKKDKAPEPKKDQRIEDAKAAVAAMDARHKASRKG